MLILDIPNTENKKEIIAELLTPMEKFLKYNYVLRQTGKNSYLGDLLEKYNTYNIKHGKVKLINA